MAQVTFTIPDNKIQRIIDMAKWYMPIPVDESGVPLFTDAQWAKEMIRRWVVQQVARYETKVAKDAAVVASDNTIIE